MSTNQDNVELLEFNSSSSSKSHFKTKFSINDNRVESSPNYSPVQSPVKHETDYSLFNKNAASKLNPLLINRNRKLLHKSTVLDNLQRSNNLHNKFSESAFSVKSDGSSHREKFKERFESVKERAGRSAFTANISKTKSSKIELLKRNINLIHKENQKVDLDFENYKDIKKANNRSNDSFVSKAEAYQFFCQNSTTNNKEINEGEECQTSDAVEKSMEVLIPISHELDNDEMYLVKSFTDDLKLYIQLSETNLFWTPSRKILDTKNKLIIGDPRFLADEGLFVESKLRVQSFHLNMLEQRLLSSKDKKWFNCEGELDTLPYPYSSISYRLQLNNVKDLFTTYYTRAITDGGFDNKILFNNNTIKFEFISLKFSHHPLFSSEHVLEQKLIELYDEYNQLISTNKIVRIYRRLEALRNSSTTLRKGNSDSCTETENSYIKEIKNLRELYFETSEHSRLLLQLILKTWKAIKNIRTTKGYSSTAIKLSIRKEKCDYKIEKAIWDRNIRQTCEEILLEFKQEYDSNMVTYKDKLHEVKWHIKNNINDNLLLEKPIKPLKNFDYNEIENTITTKFTDCFKAPGEPNLHLNLYYNNEISINANDTQEKLRRNAVLSTKVFLKLLSNKSEICKLGPVYLNEEFLCLFNESISIELSTALNSTNLILEIYEQSSTMMKRKLGELKINANIPQENALIVNNNKSYKQSFEKTDIVHYKHEGVGSGIELKNIFTDVDDAHNISLNTLGIINYKLQWHFGSDGGKNELNGDFNIVENILNENGKIDISKLIKWSNENNPDPQDPKNASLFEYLNNYNEDFDSNKLLAPSVSFRYNQDLSSLVFCDGNDIQKNVRFRVLELRNKNEPEFLGTIVPNNPKHIPLYILDDYKRRINEENYDNLSEDSVLNDYNIKSRRSYGYRLLMQAYIKIFQQCRNGKNNLTYEDVVNEKIIPNIESFARNIVSFVVNWIQAQPTIQFILPTKILKPLSNRKIELNKSIKILITVKSAINLPQRCRIQESQMINDNDLDFKLQEENVQYFVKANYRDIYLETSKVCGTNPIWNEELIVLLETKSTDYMSPNSLNDSILLNLFNEVTLKSENKYLSIKNWLGFIDIPISAIAYNNKIDGMFELRKPSILLGYEEEGINFSISRKPVSKSVLSTYLYLKISLNPNIPKLSQNMSEIDSNEHAYIQQYILEWNEEFNVKYPDRKFSALAISIDGKSTCVTRYLKPLEPPQLSVDRFSVTADQCAAYVSMIPFTDTNHFYQNVWLTTEQLLKLSFGSVIDHAIALTCYLLSLNVEVWLLLGYGLPNGSTAYVLFREHLRGSNLPLYFIYDVVNGIKYNILDDYCPLQKIYCIINEKNVWANIQTTNKIQLTRFDLTRKQDWLTLFVQQVSAPTNSIQLDLNYVNTPDVKQLEIQIDKVIRKRFLKLRKQEITVWNHTISKNLKQFLSNFEINRVDDKQEELFQVIRKLSQSYWINGYIISMSFRNIKEILEKILLTDVHLIPGINTEFVLDVKVYSYPSYVLNVSICLAAIIMKQLKD